MQCLNKKGAFHEGQAGFKATMHGATLLHTPFILTLWQHVWYKNAALLVVHNSWPQLDMLSIFDNQLVETSKHRHHRDVIRVA